MNTEENDSFHKTLFEKIDKMPFDSRSDQLEYKVSQSIFEVCLEFIDAKKVINSEIENQRNTGRVLPRIMGMIVGFVEKYAVKLQLMVTQIHKLGFEGQISTKLLSRIMEILLVMISSITPIHSRIMTISAPNFIGNNLLQKPYILGIMNKLENITNDSLRQLYTALTDPTLATPREQAKSVGGDMKKKHGKVKLRPITHKRIKTRRKQGKQRNTKKQRTRK